MDCQKCKKILSKNGSHFVCQGLCQGTFHRHCVKGLAVDLKAGRIRTSCNNCEENDVDFVDNEEESQGTDTMIKTILKKVSIFPELEKQINSITASLSVLSDKYDTLITEHEKSKEKIQKLEKRAAAVTGKLIYLEKEKTAMAQKLQEFEYVSLQRNLAIVGVEMKRDENLKEIVAKIGEMIGASCENIESIELQTVKAGNNTAPIIIGFTNSGSRDKWLSHKRKIINMTSNSLTGGTDKSKIYINEDLPKMARKLLWNAKKQLRGAYKYIWVANGRILVKKTEGEKPIRLMSECDISELAKNT